MGYHKFTEGFEDYFQLEECYGIDLGNVELKTLKPFESHSKTYYRFNYRKKDNLAEYLLFYHLYFGWYYLVKGKTLEKQQFTDNCSILDSQIEKIAWKVFESGNEMYEFMKQIIEKKYLRDLDEK